MISIKTKNIEILQFKSFQDANCMHFSTTKHGGVSQGNYESLNLGNFSDDNPECVNENRKRLCETINITSDNLFIPHQTHDTNSLIIDNRFLSMPKEEQRLQMEGIDAIITHQKDICIGVTTADCVPVLLYDQKNKILAAIHAGWKGTAANITAKTIDKMIAKYNSDPRYIIAGIGPSISAEYFEVGDEVGVSFTKARFDLTSISFHNIETNKLHINLWEANKICLTNKGIPHSNIEVAEICTYSNPQLFFSARRQTIHSGRMLTGGMVI